MHLNTEISILNVVLDTKVINRLLSKCTKFVLFQKKRYVTGIQNVVHSIMNTLKSQSVEKR